MLDMILSMETVSSHPLTILLLLMEDVEIGIGPTKSATHVPTTGSSTTMEFVSQSTLTVELTTQVEPALDATRDMTYQTEPASSPPSTLLVLPCLDAKSGTGMPKLAQSALLTGTLMPTESALRFPPSVPLTTLMELVSAATVDSTSTMVSAK